MELTFLGTSSMIPSKQRNHSGIFLKTGKEGILFDCGEGTQRQFRYANIKPTKVTIICLTHWHGDHVLGLPGLLDTLSASAYQGTIKIFGPKGTKTHFAHILKAFPSQRQLDIEIDEVERGTIFSSPSCKIVAFPVRHGLPAVGYRFEEQEKVRIALAKTKKLGIPVGPLLGKLQKKHNITFKGKQVKYQDVTSITPGKIITYIPDTVYFTGLVLAAKGTDLLVCESTYDSSLTEKAKKHMHLTAEQAANIAKKAKVKQLILTHLSNRYNHPKPILDDAKKVFSKVSVAKDLETVQI